MISLATYSSWRFSPRPSSRQRCAASLCLRRCRSPTAGTAGSPRSRAESRSSALSRRAPPSFVSGVVDRLYLPLVLGAGAAFALGLWDDAKSIGADTKFAGQVAIALFAASAGLRRIGCPPGRASQSRA